MIHTKKPKPFLDLVPLYRWYDQNKRDLPFRQARTPYAVWVSEVMLQQTRTGAMRGPYENFLKRFPIVQVLAQAAQEEVLSAWKGLGYYSRARNLHRGALCIMQKHQGHFPQEWATALSIPGVGPYIAAAVLSIAYEQPFAVLDGNVKRVLPRLYYIKTLTKNLAELAQNLIQSRGDALPSEHNQALMELGAVLCTPKTPKCSLCPLNKQCLSYKKGGAELAAQIPPPKKESFIELRLKLWLIFSTDARRLLLVKESQSRFFKNLWFLPYAYKNTAPFSPKAAPHFPALARRVPLRKKRLFPQNLSHAITHHKISAQVEALWLEKEGQARVLELLEPKRVKGDAPKAEWLWVERKRAENHLVSSLAHKALRMLEYE